VCKYKLDPLKGSNDTLAGRILVVRENQKEVTQIQQLSPAKDMWPFPRRCDPYQSRPASVWVDRKGQIAMRKAKTHFEQIPVELVRKIAEEESPERKAIVNDSVIVKIPARKTESHTAGVRLLCRNAV
jgi:hypothetical protein